ncbi:hypothetical protein [Candidatus Tisiphia endosymbiont of Temnostethus pusillus]|uniref:hypothetical protein n=1 Tax=Candidatus Tisiphia endosymbiont of Temnostethus pusillus TaxID=3139335 RepID=UPI0035C882EB
MTELLNSQFENVDTKLIYDPFYLEALEGQSKENLIKEFYAYLISLFNLNRLLPANISFNELFNYEESSYWENINSLFISYFCLAPEELERITETQDILTLSQVNVPIVDKLSFVKTKDDKVAIVAPRSALIGLGR